jgi:hypothetical protein
MGKKVSVFSLVYVITALACILIAVAAALLIVLFTGFLYV